MLDDQKTLDLFTDLQLEIEEMSPEALRQRGAELRRTSEQKELSFDDRITMTMFAFAAILRSPVLSAERKDDLQEAWLEGIGVTHEELRSAMPRKRRVAPDHG